MVPFQLLGKRFKSKAVEVVGSPLHFISKQRHVVIARFSCQLIRLS